MSTCPEKDIHSIYLDNELPLSYIASYEAHVASCPKCKAQLDKLRAIRKAFKDDADKIVQDYSGNPEDGFSRLQTRLSYSRVTGKNNVLDFSKAVKSIKYIAGGIAAAAVIAFIVPVRQQNGAAQQGQQVADFTPVARPAPMNQNYSSQVNFNKPVSSFDADGSIYGVSGASANISPLDYYVSSVSPYEQDYNYTYQVSSLASYDVFGPEPPDYSAMQERNMPDMNGNGGITLNFYSPFAQFSLKIGNSK